MKHAFKITMVFVLGWLLWYGVCCFIQWDINLTDGWSVKYKQNSYTTYRMDLDQYTRQPNFEHWRIGAVTWFICSICLYLAWSSMFVTTIRDIEEKIIEYEDGLKKMHNLLAEKKLHEDTKILK